MGYCLWCKRSKIIRNLEISKDLPEISILGGMEMLVSAWNAAFIKTIVTCFCKVGIFTANKAIAIADKVFPFKDIQDVIDALRNIEPDLITNDVNAASLFDFDAEVSEVEPPFTDSEILSESVNGG